MKLLKVLEHRKNRAVWSDPERKLRTLESFAETEEDGGKDLEVAARKVLDPDLRLHLERHAKDERRHADLFRTQAARMRAQHSLEARHADESDQSYDLSRGRKGAEIDAHGFFHAGLFDEMGEVSYVAMLHVAEKRAAEIFAMHGELTKDDPELNEVFTQILRDEKYHVSYTERFLEKWRAEGRDTEVEDGLSSAKNSRFLGSWKRLGMRSAGHFAKFVLAVFYCTVLVPFGLISRMTGTGPSARSRIAGAKRTQAKSAQTQEPALALRSQY